MINIDHSLLNHECISSLWKSKIHTRWFLENEVDFKNVKTVDSSAVAFLIKWVKACKQRNEDLVCYNVPQQLTQLINIYNVTNYIKIK